MAPPWFDVLLAPVRPRVEAAWRRLPGDPAVSPRAGLGGAVVAQVAKGFGTRRWQEAGRVAIAVVEAVNQRVHRGPVAEDERNHWISADLRAVIATTRAVARRDEMLLRRVVARVLGGPSPGAAPVPEAVMFLRGAVAAGVIAGDVPDAIHARLDAWATALGTAMEAAEQGELPMLEAARLALEDVPDCDARERMLAVLDPGPAPTGASRDPAGWEPHPLPPTARGDDPMAAAIEGALSGEGPLRDAARWLATRGGKRVRGRIAMAAARAVGGSPDAALPIAAAVEWVHTASLVLDDIVDEADLRRGAPALHRATSTPFAIGVAGWVLLQVGLADTDIADTMLALAEGQRAELARAGDVRMSPSDWYTIAAAKTGRLFSAAAALGGAAGGASGSQRRALARYGQEVGLAFQIVDDMLDLVGDETALGKRPGQDLRVGRVTWPMLVLREIDAKALDGDVFEAIARHDVVPRCLERAREHRERAISAIRGLPGGTEELAAIADLCVERRA